MEQTPQDPASSDMMDSIPDDALVVRGGLNQPEHIRRGLGTHPTGVYGVSVECTEGLSVRGLATTLPHRQIGVTTVGRVRAMGGDVVRTFGTSPNHATLVGLTPEQASLLLTPTIPNPNPRRRQ